MTKLCIGTVLKILKVVCIHQNDELGETLFREIYGNEAVYSPTKFSRLITCARPTDEGMKEKYGEQEPAKKIKCASKIIELIKANLHYETVLALKSIIIEDKEVKPTTVIGYDKKYTKEAIDEMTEFVFSEFLANILHYVILHAENVGDNKEENEEYKECLKKINKDYIKSFSDKVDSIILIESSENTINEHDLTDYSMCLSKNQVLFRDKEIDEIIQKINDKSTRGLVLSGMGGCGKTSIAGVIYGLLKNEFDYCGWINYVGTLEESMIRQINIGEYSNNSMSEKDIKQKWDYIKSKIKDNKKSKLFIIDNVVNIEGIQTPLTDEDLLNFINIDNAKIILTSQFSKIGRYETVKIDNLGNEANYDNCVELFYYYNDVASNNREANNESVRKLCKIASYNTMVIELLAKACMYSDCTTLEEFTNMLEKEEGFNYIDDVIVDTLHDNNEIYTLNDNGSVNKKYYDKNKETGKSQLIKLFNMKKRSPLERQILWDFHCLPEAERVSKEELNNWMGYTNKDLKPLTDESWIKLENGFYYMHPLIKKAIDCDKTEKDWEKYWNQREEREQQDIISEIKNETLFLETDTFELGIRKIYFAYYLSYFGKFLKPEELIYIADAARNRGVRKIGISVYECAFHILYKDELCKDFVNKSVTEDFIDRYININIEQLDILKLFWKSTYYLAYMLSFTKRGLNAAKEALSVAIEICEKLSSIENVLSLIDYEVTEIYIELKNIIINSELLRIEYKSSEKEYEIANLTNKTLKSYTDKLKKMLMDESELSGLGNNILHCYLKELNNQILNDSDSEDLKDKLLEHSELDKISAMTYDHYGYILCNNLNPKSYNLDILYPIKYFGLALKSRISLVKHDIYDLVKEKKWKKKRALYSIKDPTKFLAPIMDEDDYKFSNFLNPHRYELELRYAKYDSFFMKFHEFMEKYDLYQELIFKESMRGLAWTCDNIGAFYANIDSSGFGDIRNRYKDKFKEDFETSKTRVIKHYECLIEGEKHAELLLEEALKIRKAQNILTEVAWTECNLAMLLSKGDDIDKAKEHVESAIEIYKELEIEYPEQHISSLARAYKIYVNILKKDCSINQDTLDIYNEVMGIYQKLEQDSPGLYKDEIEDLKLQIIDAQKLINS